MWSVKTFQNVVDLEAFLNDPLVPLANVKFVYFDAVNGRHVVVIFTP